MRVVTDAHPDRLTAIALPACVPDLNVGEALSPA